MNSYWTLARQKGTLGVVIAAVLASLLPSRAETQEQRGYPIDAIEAYVAAGLPPSRIWDRYLSKSGIAFDMDAPTIARLRASGADDAWIAMLKGARFVPGSESLGDSLQVPAAAERPVPEQSVSAPPPSSLSRRDLYPLYYQRPFRVSTYVGLSRIRETSGQVVGHVFSNSVGDTVTLYSHELEVGALTYGILVDLGTPGAALDVELYLHQPNVRMVHIGLALEPFLPLVTSGVRVIAGITPFSGVVVQTVGHVPVPGDEAGGGAVQVWNWTYGTDVRVGLAYHFSSGPSVYGEWHYRVLRTYERDLRFPSGAFRNEPAWPPFSAKGSIFRFGIAW